MPTSKRKNQKTRPAAPSVDPRNRLNDLDSRSWLKFQKSWYVLPTASSGATAPAAEFVIFFTKKRNLEGHRSRVGLIADNAAQLSPVIKKLGREAVISNSAAAHGTLPLLDYALLDLRGAQLEPTRDRLLAPPWQHGLEQLARHLKPGAYMTIFASNSDADGRLLPWAWLIALAVGELLLLKDEKIGCGSKTGGLQFINPSGGLTPAAHKLKKKSGRSAVWKTTQEVLYCLNFRREENSGENVDHDAPPLSKTFSLTSALQPHTFLKQHAIAAPARKTRRPAATTWRPHVDGTPAPSWFVPKPPPREKNVLLHPAKFPESLVTYFLHEFSQPGEIVFDPMAGTGSTLLAALAAQRCAYGIELNPQFHGIATARLQKYLTTQPATARLPHWRLASGDAALAASYRSLPQNLDYVLTSPPYWDMLRMKGAETQQKRKQAGLLQFYSNDTRDLGNRADYEEFLTELVKIYLRVAARLAAGRYMTIVVKNIKKRGKIYPLAWHLALRLSEHLVLCHEQFWCQDDQRLSPFGYRYAWVSNTFHHYCLHFRKP